MKVTIKFSKCIGILLLIAGIALGVNYVVQNVRSELSVTPEQRTERRIQSATKDLLNAQPGNLIEASNLVVWAVVTVKSNMITVTDQNTTMTEDAAVLAKLLRPQRIVDPQMDTQGFGFVAKKFVRQCVERAQTNQMADNR